MRIPDQALPSIEEVEVFRLSAALIDAERRFTEKEESGGVGSGGSTTSSSS